MAKRPIPGRKVDLLGEIEDHGELPAGARISQPPPARASRPPKPAQTFPVTASSISDEPRPECGFVGSSLEDAVESALNAPQHMTQAGGF